jgi:excisionase family DNA binding protein
MSSQFLSLEEAAKKLGMPPETLVSMRSEGRIRGFRDGSSWKFAIEELTRFAEEIAQESEAYDPYQMAADD